MGTWTKDKITCVWLQGLGHNEEDKSSRLMKDLKKLYKKIDSRIEKHGELSEDEIQREIEEYRAEKKKH